VLRSIHVLMLSKCACLHVYYWWYLVLSLLRTFPVILYSRVHLVMNVAIIPLWLSHMRVHTGLTFRYTPDFHFPAKRHTRTHARRISRWCSGVGPGPHIFSSHFTTQVFFLNGPSIFTLFCFDSLSQSTSQFKVLMHLFSYSTVSPSIGCFSIANFPLANNPRQCHAWKSPTSWHSKVFVSCNILW